MKMCELQGVITIPYSFLKENDEGSTVFEAAVVQAVDDILTALGENPKEAIYRILKNFYNIRKEEIPCKIEGFANGIEQTFGYAVAKLIEIKIIERLHSRYRDFYYVPKKGELDFVEFIVNLQRYLTR